MKIKKIFGIFFSLILLLFLLDADYGQNKKVDTEVKIAGGMKAFQENIIYPDEAKLKGTEGDVLIKLTVNKLGRAENIVFEKGDEIFKNSAIQAVKKTEFIPATVDKKNVDCEITIPIKYRLADCK